MVLGENPHAYFVNLLIQLTVKQEVYKIHLEIWRPYWNVIVATIYDYESNEKYVINVSYPNPWLYSFTVKDVCLHPIHE